MMLRTSLFICLLAAFPFAAWCGDYLLFEPREVAPAQAVPAPGTGVLVRKMTIRPGDTLSGISLREGGKGSYYPQILLFNRIDNPHLIYAGRTLYVPVTAKAAPSASPHIEGATVTKSQTRKHDRHAVKKQKRHAASSDSDGSSLFTRGVSAYRAGNCSRAVELFDRYLRRYPDAPHAAEALLYRADCFLAMSRN